MSVLCDVINAGFEVGSSGAIALDCVAAYRQKKVSGINILSSLFFTIYSLWGIYYLWDLSQVFSSAVCVACGFFDAIFVCQIIYYRRHEFSY